MPNNVLEEKSFIFIVGCPRSGTSWLHTMMGSHPNICTTVELTLFDMYIASWIRFWNVEASNINQGRWYSGLPFIWTEEEFRDFLKEFLGKAYQKVLEKKPYGTHILDKRPAASKHVSLIASFIPKVKFIHIIRDGRDVAVSIVQANRNMGFGENNIKDAASAWNSYVLAAKEAEIYSNQYLEVRYEDLLRDGVGVLSKIYDFCEVPYLQGDVLDIVETHRFAEMKKNQQHVDGSVKANVAHFRKGKAGVWQSDMTRLEKYIFHKTGGDLLQSLGYLSNNEWWANNRFERYTLPIFYGLSVIGKRIRSFFSSIYNKTIKS